MKHPARSRFARTAFLGFLIIAAAIAAMASFTMFVTGTVLDSIWTTKERTYHQLLQHKLPVGLGFAALAVILALAATGWTRRKRWGWLLGVLILAVNLLSDTVSLIASRQPADLLGVAIGAAILTWCRATPEMGMNGDMNLHVSGSGGAGLGLAGDQRIACQDRVCCQHRDRAVGLARAGGQPWRMPRAGATNAGWLGRSGAGRR